MSNERLAFACFVAALGCCAILGGAVTMEPAWIGPALQADLQREQDMRMIAAAVSTFKIKQKELPYDLSKLAETPRSWTAPLPLSDPQSGEPYQYSRIDSQSYRLCANFKLESLPRSSAPPLRGSTQPWAHSAGANCFVFDGQSNVPLANPAIGQARF